MKMKGRLLLIGVMIIGTCAFLCNTKNIFTGSWVSNLAESKSQSVVLISTYEYNKNLFTKDTADLSAIGSGFFIDSNMIATNNHVIERADGAYVKTQDDKVFPIESILKRDANADLAIVKICTFGKKISAITNLEQSASVKVGDEIIAIGNPRGLERTVTKGIVSAIRQEQPWGKIIQIDAAISPGSSGGPVFNKRGELVGLSTFYIKGGQNLNFIIPTQSLYKLKQSIKENFYDPICNLSSEKSTEVAESLMDNGDAEGALCFAQYSLLKNPNDVLALLWQGASFTTLKHYKDALDVLNRANSLYSNDPNILYWLAQTYLKTGKTDKALGLLKQVIKIEPENVSAHNTCGACFELKGELSKAEEEYNVAIDLKPKYYLSYKNLGLMYKKQKKYKKAAEYLKKATELNEKDDQSIYELGMIFLQLNKKADALKEYKRLKNLNPEKAENLFSNIYK